MARLAGHDAGQATTATLALGEACAHRRERMQLDPARIPYDDEARRDAFRRGHERAVRLMLETSWSWEDGARNAVAVGNEEWPARLSDDEERYCDALVRARELETSEAVRVAYRRGWVTGFADVYGYVA